MVANDSSFFLPSFLTSLNHCDEVMAPASHHRTAAAGDAPPPNSTKGTPTTSATGDTVDDEKPSSTSKDGNDFHPFEDVHMMQPGEGGSSSSTGDLRPVADRTGKNKKLILDSGASVHAAGDEDLFSVLNPLAGTSWVLRVANGSALPIRGHGTVRCGDSIRLRGVVFVPGLAVNVVSVSRLGDLDYTVEFTRSGCFIRDAATGELVGQGHLADGLYELDFLWASRA